MELNGVAARSSKKLRLDDYFCSDGWFYLIVQGKFSKVTDVIQRKKFFKPLNTRYQ